MGWTLHLEPLAMRGTSAQIFNFDDAANACDDACEHIADD
jgi:hypothetical protein